MSREEYQPPTSSHFPIDNPTDSTQYNPPSGGGSGTGGAGGGSGGASGVITVTYVCGECTRLSDLSRGDPIRCKECGHRILYKQRTKRLVFLFSFFSWK